MSDHSYPLPQLKSLHCDWVLHPTKAPHAEPLWGNPAKPERHRQNQQWCMSCVRTTAGRLQDSQFQGRAVCYCYVMESQNLASAPAPSRCHSYPSPSHSDFSGDPGLRARTMSVHCVLSVSIPSLHWNPLLPPLHYHAPAMAHLETCSSYTHATDLSCPVSILLQCQDPPTSVLCKAFPDVSSSKWFGTEFQSESSQCPVCTCKRGAPVHRPLLPFGGVSPTSAKALSPSCHVMGPGGVGASACEFWGHSLAYTRQ
jgi:hypothetical protein